MQDVDVGQGTLPSGFQFGAYVIGSCVGRGGMARIYRAEHSVLRKPVALKVMESALLDRPDGHPRFLREGQAAAAVKHPNVVDITDVGVWHGRPYLVMELLEGEDLESYLACHKPLAEQDVARIMIPVVAGLVTAHGAGVIHRDLKPSNVFLSRGPDGEVVPKLLDFGISKLDGALGTLDPSRTPLGELMGSPMYMSPEAVRGARDLTPQSDQYSLGVILYECVTGRPPFYGDSLLSVLEAVAHGRFESPRRFRPELSTVLEVAILRAMSRDPAERYPSVRELGRALCEVADPRTRLLWAPSFGVREAPLARRTASLGAPPVRTAPPLTASVDGVRRGSRWPLVLAVAACMALALLAIGYSRMPSAPYSVAIPPAPVAPRVAGTAATPAALEPAAAPLAVPSRDPVLPESVAGAESGEAALEAPSARETAPPVRKQRPALPSAEKAPEVGGARPEPASETARRAPAEAPERPAERSTRPRAQPSPALPAMDAVRNDGVFPVRAPAGPRLGANQAPILD